MLNATRRRASQDQIKSLSRHAVGSKRERKPQRAYAYYSTARNEKKGAYTMSTNEMTSKIRELKELKAMAEELAAEITAIEDTIKAEMTARNIAKRQQNAGLTFNGYGIGDYTAWYLTEYGFYIAATYRNVERIREGDGWNE